MYTPFLWATPFFISLVLAACFVPVARWLSWRLGLVDSPVGHRYKTHDRPVPYGGGVAIYIGVLLPIVALSASFPSVGGLRLNGVFVPGAVHSLTTSLVQMSQVLSLFLCASALFLLGLVDDWRQLQPLLRFAVQVAAAALLAFGVPGFRLPLGGPAVVDAVASVVWMTAMTNAFNFLDNMDGLAAGVAVVCLGAAAPLALAAGHPPAALLSLMLAGAAAGFLLFNFPRASIFMGDAGGFLLGFAAGALTVLLSNELAAGRHPDFASAAHRLAPLLLLGVPAYDLASVIIIRVRGGAAPWIGDTNHISHRVVRLGLSRRSGVLAIHGLTSLTAALGLWLIYLSATAARRALLVFVVAVAAVAALDFFAAPRTVLRRRDREADSRG